MARGFDVWEGKPYLPAADFILIRAYNGGRPDKAFSNLYAMAKGRYRYGRGVWGYVLPGDTRAQADAMLALIPANDPPELGVFSDLEQVGLTHDEALAHTQTLHDATQHAGFYSNLNDFANMLEGGRGFESFPWWVANPSGDPVPRAPLISQTGTPTIDVGNGVLDNVDADYADDTTLAAWTSAALGQPEQQRGLVDMIDLPWLVKVVENPNDASGAPVADFWALFQPGQRQFVEVNDQEALTIAADKECVQLGERNRLQFDRIRSGVDQNTGLAQ